MTGLTPEDPIDYPTPSAGAWKPYFPLAEPREKQEKALDFILDAMGRGFEHIVVEMPTGLGKSAAAIAINEWAASEWKIDGFKPGGYHLVTQLLLQDQIEQEFSVSDKCKLAGIRSSPAYVCPMYRNCQIGGAKRCAIKFQTNEETVTYMAKEELCPYQAGKIAFYAAHSAVTNYAWFLTEMTMSGQSPPRSILVLDEAHTVPKMLMQFFEVNIEQRFLDEMEIDLVVPQLETLMDLVQWMDGPAWPAITIRLDELQQNIEVSDVARQKLLKLGLWSQLLERSMTLIEADPSKWVFWQRNHDDGSLETIARALTASLFAPDLYEMGHTKIYLSAYLGDQNVFCREMGLDREKVAWARFQSPFPVKNRKIIVDAVGSMAHQSKASTLPKMLRKITQIAQSHGNEKGIIHTVSYDLAIIIAKHLSQTMDLRVICPLAGEREQAMDEHFTSAEPTILISPSITEGFDFANDKARWCIMAKVPWPYLPDKHIAAKRDHDPDWYPLQAVATIIQGSGRICRSVEDYGTTYILDKDFYRLFDKNNNMFPRWWSNALVWRD